MAATIITFFIFNTAQNNKMVLGSPLQMGLVKAEIECTEIPNQFENSISYFVLRLVQTDCVVDREFSK